MFMLGVITARGGSKRIPKKNMYCINGNPLIYYTINSARNSKLNDFLVSSEDDEILSYAKNMGTRVIKRPEHLATDLTPSFLVIKDAVAVYEKETGNSVDAVMTLQPTSPLRTQDDIDATVSMFALKDCDSIVSVVEVIHPSECYDQNGKLLLENTEISIGIHGEIHQIKHCDQEGNRILMLTELNKQKHKCYTRNGAIFITRRDLLEIGSLVGNEPILYIMPKTRSIDIDTTEDMKIAEAILKAQIG